MIADIILALAAEGFSYKRSSVDYPEDWTGIDTGDLNIRVNIPAPDDNSGSHPDYEIAVEYPWITKYYNKDTGAVVRSVVNEDYVPEKPITYVNYNIINGVLLEGTYNPDLDNRTLPTGLQGEKAEKYPVTLKNLKANVDAIKEVMFNEPVRINGHDWNVTDAVGYRDFQKALIKILIGTAPDSRPWRTNDGQVVTVTQQNVKDILNKKIDRDADVDMAGDLVMVDIKSDPSLLGQDLKNMIITKMGV